jgi:hypothetical protein
MDDVESEWKKGGKKTCISYWISTMQKSGSSATRSFNAYPFLRFVLRLSAPARAAPGTRLVFGSAIYLAMILFT